MLVRNALFLKQLQQLAPKSDFPVHEVLADIERAETGAAGNTHNAAAHLPMLWHNHGARSCRRVGVLDADRDPGTYRRDDRFIVQNPKSGIRQFTHFAKGYLLNRSRIRDNSWICRQHGIHVGKVFIDLSPHRRRKNGSGNIRSPTREGDNFALDRVAKEPRKHNDAFGILQGCKVAIRLREQTSIAIVVAQEQPGIPRVNVGRRITATLQFPRHQSRAVVLASSFHRIQITPSMLSVPTNGSLQGGGNVCGNALRDPEFTTDRLKTFSNRRQELVN